MQDKFYFTRDREVQYASFLADAMQESLDANEYSDEPDALNDGILYRVTIEQVGRIRTTKEVEFDPAKQEESD